MSVLERLVAWKNGRRSRAVEIRHDTGFGAACWEVHLRGGVESYKEVHAAEVSFCEVHMSQDIAAVLVVLAETADQLGNQRDPALLEQLVVHGLIEVAEHVHVAPPQLDADAVLKSG